MRIIKIQFSVILFWFLLIAAKADWPKFRGPTGQGIWDCPGLPLKIDNPKKVWEHQINGGYSGITIKDGKVYTMDRPENKNLERILCFEEKSGELIWEHQYEANYKGLSYDIGPRASVTIFDGKAFTFGAVGHMHCLDMNNGKVIWAKDSRESFGAKRPIWGFSSSPAPWNQSIIYQIGSSSGGYIALDPDKGSKIWSGSDDPAGYATPSFIKHAGNEIMLAWTPENIRGMSPNNGDVLWSFPYKIKYGVSIAMPIYHDNVVLVCGYWHGSKALLLGEDGKSVKLLWEDKDNIRGLMAQPLQKDGLVYLLDRTNGLSCFEITTGKKHWDDSKNHIVTPSGRNPQATLVWANDGKRQDRALILNANGELLSVTLSKEGFEIHSRSQITGKTWAHPAYNRGHIFARTDKKIVCWELNQ